MTIHADFVQQLTTQATMIRVENVRLTASYQRVLAEQDYPSSIAILLGEALVAAVLLVGTMAFEGQLSITLRSTTAVKTLVVKCTHDYKLRGLAHFDRAADAQALEQWSQDAHLMISVQTPAHTGQYQTIIPVTGLGLADSLTQYFAHSELLATRFWIAAEDGAAAGFLLQQMPLNQSVDSRQAQWQCLIEQADALLPHALHHVSVEDIWRPVLSAGHHTLHDPQRVQFHCPCTLEKMRLAVQALGQAQAMRLIEQYQSVKVACEYCSSKYDFSPVEVAAIFAESGQQDSH